MQFSTKIDGFEQKDSQGFENSYNSYEQYPLENFFIFTIYQNYTLALTGLFESKFLLRGGGVNLIPPSDLGPKGPIAAKFCMDVKTHLKSIATGKKMPKTVYLLYYYNLCK